MKMRGRVIRRVLYEGTKSEHEGMVLVVPDGEFKLRRRGGNPFQDKTLSSLDGKVIEGEGLVRKNQFILSSWNVID